MLMQFTAELTAVKCQFSDEKCHFCFKPRLWVEVKTAISEGSNGFPKSCLGAKITTIKIVSPLLIPVLLRKSGMRGVLNNLSM